MRQVSVETDVNATVRVVLWAFEIINPNGTVRLSKGSHLSVGATGLVFSKFLGSKYTMQRKRCLHIRISVLVLLLEKGGCSNLKGVNANPCESCGL